MAANAIITLQRLRCIREAGEGGEGSAPYLWPVLLWIDDATATVGAVTPPVEYARIVIKNGMHANETADIFASVGVLDHRFDDDLTKHQLILVVALWEANDTSVAALNAGF